MLYDTQSVTHSMWPVNCSSSRDCQHTEDARAVMWDLQLGYRKYTFSVYLSFIHLLLRTRQQITSAKHTERLKTYTVT